MLKCGIFIFDNLAFLFQTPILSGWKKYNLGDLFPRMTYDFRRTDTELSGHNCVGLPGDNWLQQLRETEWLRVCI